MDSGASPNPAALEGTLGAFSHFTPRTREKKSVSTTNLASWKPLANMSDLSILYSPAPYHIIRSARPLLPLVLSLTDPTTRLAMALSSAAPSTNPS